MDKLSAYESYVSAVNTGSLSGAARQRRISQPAVSQQITTLEKLLGTRLLHRDRRGVRMTRAGEAVYRRACAIISEQQSLLADLQTLSGRVAGQLKITASLGLSQHLISKVVVKLAKQFPELKILLHPNDRVLDIAKEDIDIAIRFGGLGQSAGIARKFAMLEMVHVATPAYLETVGRPRTPSQLAKLDYIQYRDSGAPTNITLTSKNRNERIKLDAALTAQLPDLAFQALYSNLGFSSAPKFLVSEAISKGKLELVLPKWKLPPTELFLVFPSRDTNTPPILAFLRALFERLEKIEGAEVLPSARNMVA